MSNDVHALLRYSDYNNFERVSVDERLFNSDNEQILVGMPSKMFHILADCQIYHLR
jgi:hypothetical protein